MIYLDLINLASGLTKNSKSNKHVWNDFLTILSSTGFRKAHPVARHGGSVGAPILNVAGFASQIQNVSESKKWKQLKKLDLQ